MSVLTPANQLTLTRVLLAPAFVILTVYNDVMAYNTARAAGKHALINSALGTFLVLAGTPIYFLCRSKVNKV